MQFNHDNMTGPLLAADLVTLENRGWNVLAAQEILATHHIRRNALSVEAAERLREWSIRLRTAFDAGTVVQRCEAVNGLLSTGTSQAYLTVHDELKPHLHFTSEDDDVVARVQAVTAGGLAVFVVEAEGNRLGVCQRNQCGVVFVDTSRNGARAYCTAKCGNYDAVRRHRTGAQ